MPSFESCVDGPGTGQIKPQTAAVGTSDPLAKIPIADFISYVEVVEKSYPVDKPREILTRIRQQYYFDFRFQQLIPDAPSFVPAKKDPGAGWELRRLGPELMDPNVYPHLSAKADEVGFQDNPSPYVIARNKDEIDIGHVLLGLDALLHRTTGRPFTSFGIPSIDPASWVGDLAPAVTWTSLHKKNAKPARDAPKKAGQLINADFDQYYEWSAPQADLLGDADAFGMSAQWVLKPDQRLSQVLREYYQGNPEPVKRRWRTFCNFIDPADHLPMFPFTLFNSGHDALFEAEPLGRWTRRIDRLADLLVFGNQDLSDKLWLAIVPPPAAPPAPAPVNFPETHLALNKFADWLRKQLESELRAP